MGRGALAAGLAITILLATALTAAATPVATTEQQRQLYGRVFQEPIRSVNFIQHGPSTGQVEEYRLGMELLARTYPRYMTFTSVGKELGTPYAFSPGPDKVPPWSSSDSHDGYPFYVSIVTDKTVPDEDKEYVLITNAHSAEPCGREASARYLEDLLIWATTDPGRMLDDNKGNTGVTHRMTVAELLKRTKIYLVSTSPDGWVSGDGANSALSRYSNFNDAGANTNRVAFQEGWVYPNTKVLVDNGYSVLRQPEGAAVTTYLRRERERHGRPFAAAADIHGPVPVGAILLHDQGNSPEKLVRVDDLAERVKQNMDATLASYITPTGASVYEQAAAQAETVRNLILNLYTGTTGNSVDKVAFLPLQWATYGRIWDQLSYTVTGSWGGWANSDAGLGADAISYEVDCMSYGGWDPALMQLFVDNMRSIIQATAVNAAARTLGSVHPTRDLHNRVGFYETGWRLTERTSSLPPPAGFPGNPFYFQLHQSSYNVSNTDYFRDLRRMVTSPIVDVRSDHLREDLAGVDTLVIADSGVPDAGPLKEFVARGGNLVLTDRAIGIARAFTHTISTEQVTERNGYVGFSDLDRKNPITDGLPRLARQSYDPVGLGYPLLMERDQYWSSGDSGTVNSAPIYMIDRAAWEAAGGQTIGTADPPPTPKAQVEGQATNKTTVGILPVGKGRVVVFGALLPRPTDRYTHWFGLDAYTISDGFQELLLRTLTWKDTGATAPASVPGPGGPVALPLTGAGGFGLLELGVAVAVAGIVAVRPRRRRATRVD